MKIVEKDSVYAGEEFLIVHHKKLYNQIIRTVSSKKNNLKQEKNLEKELVFLGWNKVENEYYYFLKNKIALSFYSNISQTVFEYHLGINILNYSLSKIDMAINIIPSKMIHQVRKLNSPVPLLILGVEP